MADYWKSQPRKFCQYCKCWIADNKPSVEFHERGKNHKENVAAKISEIKKKSIEKAKQEERQSKEFAAMEEAALKAYQEDLKRMEREAQGFSSPVLAPPSNKQPQPLVKPQVIPQVKPQGKPQAKHQFKKGKKKDGKAFMKSGEERETQVWVEGLSDEGHTYYYNSVTGESRWEKPDSFEGETSVTDQIEETESPDSVWKEAVSPEGYTYYYNQQTGESSWEKPADFPSNEASGSSSESNREAENVEQASASEAETLTGVEESSSGAPATSQQTEAPPEEASQQPKVPKISFRKRKANTEPSEIEGEDESGVDKGTEDSTKEDDKEREKEVQSATAAPERTEETATKQQTHSKKPKTANPYGAWEKIQEEEDPYANVDLELPEVEGSTADAPPDLPPEPKLKFKERVITSLGDEGGPASFRKNKTQNGKSRSLRQRDNDD